MNNDIRFSIVTITFNAVHTLERTIESVIRQTYTNVEYVVIDGGSKDGTTDIIKRFAPYISFWLSEPDKGLYDAMNKAMAHCTGDYIVYLNAGDKFATETLLADIADRIHKAGKGLPDVVYGDTAIVDDKGEYMGMRQHRTPEQLTWHSFRQGMLVCHQAFFAKRSLVEPYDLQYRFSADFDWCIRILKKSSYTLHTHTILIHYLNEGVTTRNHRASLKERFRIMAHHYGWLSTVFLHIWFVFRSVGYKFRK